MCTAGSMLEGGGQILRNAAALAAITSTPIKVSKIRAGRSKPGLRAQHLAGLQLVADLCQGNIEGGTIGSQEISLTPHYLSCGHHIGDTKTAGSCMLLAQVQHIHTPQLLLQIDQQPSCQACCSVYRDMGIHVHIHNPIQCTSAASVNTNQSPFTVHKDRADINSIPSATMTILLPERLQVEHDDTAV